MTGERCPSCGAEIPEEVGQHALVPSAGIVECPTCGATVTLEKPTAETGAGESSRLPRTEGEEESFAGEETLEGVMEEVEEKEEG
jgi:endogenous inhibitor of DNA gyrase (YacG/DUF329 family)